MSWSHLRKTRIVRIVGGGATKLRPLFTVLLAAKFDAVAKKMGSGTAPIVTELSTDEKTANALLSAIDILKENPELAAWYQKRLHEIDLCAHSHKT